VGGRKKNNKTTLSHFANELCGDICYFLSIQDVKTWPSQPLREIKERECEDNRMIEKVVGGEKGMKWENEREFVIKRVSKSKRESENENERVCVCVKERVCAYERKGVCEIDWQREKERKCVYVCVCVCVKQREVEE